MRNCCDYPVLMFKMSLCYPFPFYFFFSLSPKCVHLGFRLIAFVQIILIIWLSIGADESMYVRRKTRWTCLYIATNEFFSFQTLQNVVSAPLPSRSKQKETLPPSPFTHTHAHMVNHLNGLLWLHWCNTDKAIVNSFLENAEKREWRNFFMDFEPVLKNIAVHCLFDKCCWANHILKSKNRSM